jgi:tyrosinase
MQIENSHPFAVSRRQFLAASAATFTAAAFPVGSALAQAPARWRRRSISAPDFPPRVLDSYKKAIRAMLNLPISDPRNWYRHALIHAMDCPHGNWWFLVWHRGYLGWFEQICRELSGDPDFALPYWDWTAEPRVPAAMFEDVLTPTNRAYIDTARAFRLQFQDILPKTEYWRRSNSPDGAPDQFSQLLARNIRFPEDLWFDLVDDPRGSMFFDLAHARGLTRERPDLDDRTKRAVAMSTIVDALAPRDFLTFGSPRSEAHGTAAGFGILEGQSHNRVHVNLGGRFDGNDVGGFMQANLSPIDPIFFLHHGNIDRLWDVWTRKQLARGLATLPDGYAGQPGAPPRENSDYEAWSTEPFLFFVDGRGQRVSKVTAADYAAIGDFNYDYQPGSGEQVVAVTVAAAPQTVPNQRFNGQIGTKSVGATTPASGSVTVPGALITAAAPEAPRLFAKVTVAVSPKTHSDDLAVLVNAPPGAPSDPSSPYYAGSLAVFGHQGVHGALTFTLPLSGPVTALRTSKAIGVSEPLNIRVASDTRMRGMTHGNGSRAEVLSITVEQH